MARAATAKKEVTPLKVDTPEPTTPAVSPTCSTCIYKSEWNGVLLCGITLPPHVAKASVEHNRFVFPDYVCAFYKD